MTSALIDAVAAVLREAATLHVMPRFRALAAGEIEEKAPGDPVTIADREAEAHIARGLRAIRPQACFIGEEACSRDPALIERLGEGEAWIVDPIDGTANFAAGHSPFALQAALLVDGAIVAACIYDPLADRMTAAELGGGAWANGVRLQTSDRVPRTGDLRGIVSRFALPDAMCAGVAAVEAAVGPVSATRRCAADEYPRVAAGEQHFALYWRTLAWDHAPGVLILREAGGVADRVDGSAYRPAVAGTGMLLAHNPGVADVVRGLILGSGAEPKRLPV